MGEKLSNELTDKEREMHEYIVKYMEENLISPSFQEICKGVNTKSKSCVGNNIFSVAIINLIVMIFSNHKK